MTAWGAVCDGIRTGGAWSHHEANHMHINELELLAAFFGLKTLAKEMINKHIQVYVDNTVAMACLNKMGSSKTEKLNTPPKVVWQWCYTRNLLLTLARIPGSENQEADHAKRHINLDTEWKLDSELLNTALDGLMETIYKKVYNVYIKKWRRYAERKKSVSSFTASNRAH